MAVNSSSYACIKSELLVRYNDTCTEGQLRAVVDVFKDRIRSVRRVNNVKSLRELVQLLEKRCVLSPQELGNLDVIAMAFGSNIIELRQGWYDRVGATAITYRPIRVPPPLPHHGPPQFPVLDLQPATAHDRIYALVINKIGLKWQELARNLKIGEGKIDELEEKHKFSPSERVREILAYTEINTGPQWVYILMDALFNSRRADLRNEVQKIVMGSH